MKLWTNIGKFAHAVQKRGLSRAIDVTCAHLLANERRRFEQAHGVDTEQPAMLEDLTIDSSRRDDGFYYAPSHPRVVHAMVANIPTDLSDVTFVDYGSGKGIVLLLAAMYPFREVVGVEFAQELHEIAEQNIAKFNGPQRRCERVRSVNEDAAEFEIPASDCALYFCNPFTDSIMTEVVDNIGRSFKEHGQRIFVLFQQLKEEEENSMADPVPIFEAAPFLRERRFRTRSLWEQFLLKHLTMKVYETKSPSD